MVSGAIVSGDVAAEALMAVVDEGTVEVIMVVGVVSFPGVEEADVVEMVISKAAGEAAEEVAQPSTCPPLD